MKKLRATYHSLIGIFLFFGSALPLQAQEEEVSGKKLFMPNKGQWDSKVLYRSQVPGGSFYIEDNGFTYQRVDGEQIQELHHSKGGEAPSKVDAHAVRVRLKGASTSEIQQQGRSDYYANFYRGKDPSKWAERVHGYQKVDLKDAYPGIDLRFKPMKEGVKYSFHCSPRSDPSLITLAYDGQENLELTKDGSLRIRTSVGDIVEEAPIAYQWIDGKKEELPCRFVVKDGRVGFKLPEGYDESKSLIIDPKVIFSTYTGSTADNWGNTATYDSDGALYAGGTVFDQGYPTSSGAYQVNFGGGEGGYSCDVSISKFASDGTSLIYSTYFGGSANELPHSFVVNGKDQLYLLGSTGSSDLPLDSNAADTSFGGGGGGKFGVITFNKGSDAFISKFSSDGTALLASTYLGGSGNDGLNEAGALNYNYGDILRGEIEVDGSGNAYVVSTTRSNDLPVTSGVFQDTLNGKQDAFISKLDPTLSNILYCSYYGGSDQEAGYAIERNPGFGFYITGGTKSNDLPMPQGWKTSQQGGVDGFVAHFEGGADSLLNGSYIGTSDYDQSYFLARDTADNIFLYGQSTGTYPVKNAAYSNPNSGQFIQMLPPDLSSSTLSTVFGTGSGKVDISPSAFMVSNCDNIYLSGWGGNTNQGHGVNSSTTKGLPITKNAYQSSTDGSDFYLMVLGDSASSIKYGSFFGGGVSEEHVDGGTSRFDDRGIVYQAVCGGCGGNSDFPTTPGAHSSQNKSWNCNLAAFKFDLAQLTADVDIDGPSISCGPDSFQLKFGGTGGTYYEWDFGDGTTGTGDSVSHYYSDTGTYQIRLVVHDTLTCRSTDTAYRSIQVVENPSISTDPDTSICPGDTAQLGVDGGISQKWIPSASLDDSSVSEPLAFPDSSTNYRVEITDSNGCKNVDSVQVSILPGPEVKAEPDTFICQGDSVQLQASGAVSYQWSPGSSLDDPSISDPKAAPQGSTVYQTVGTDKHGCKDTTQLHVQVDTTLPDPEASGDTVLCRGDSSFLQASGGREYEWTPVSNLSHPDSSVTYGWPNKSSNYKVLVINGCGEEADSVHIQVKGNRANAKPDTIICPGDSVALEASGGMNYRWEPGDNLSDPERPSPILYPPGSGSYQVIVTDSLGCQDTAKVQVDRHPKPELRVGKDLKKEWGSKVDLQAIGDKGKYRWHPEEVFENPNRKNVSLQVKESGTYWVELTDTNGCRVLDSLDISVSGSLYAPNAFTPNGDGVNDIWRVKGEEIGEFHLKIFDRWGELLFETQDLNEGWDGTYKGDIVKPDVYVYRIVYTEAYQPGKVKTKTGHITVVR